MKIKLKERLKFFGLSYFSDKIARTAPKFGFGTLCLALLLSFLFFLFGYLAADTVPFSTHYENAGQYKQFIASAFAEGGVSFSVKDKKASADKIINTYTNDDDKADYSKNGYDLIVDTRPSDMLIIFTQVAVKGETEISYEDYLALPEAEKSSYKLETRCTDEELKITDALVEKYTASLNVIRENNMQAAAAYDSLKESQGDYTEEEYGKELYYLYVQYYHTSVSSVLYGSKAPVLRDYYYINYIAGNSAYYFYLFDEICAGSFETDGGLPVVFGGYFDKCADGAVIDIDGLIKQVYYNTVGYTFVSYFMGAVRQLPFLILVPIVLALLLWGVGKLVKDGWEKTFTGCFKVVGSFIWVSALITALITFVFGFFVAARVMFTYMALIFSLLLLIRTVVYCITTVKANRKPFETETQNNNDDIFGGEL